MFIINLASTRLSELKTSSQITHGKEWKISEEFCKTKRHVAISCCLVTFLKRQLQLRAELGVVSTFGEIDSFGTDGGEEGGGKGRRLKR